MKGPPLPAPNEPQAGAAPWGSFQTLGKVPAFQPGDFFVLLAGSAVTVIDAGEMTLLTNKVMLLVKH